MSSLRVPPFLPLLAAYPVIFLATSNPGQVSWSLVAGVTAVSIASALLLFFLLRPLARSPTSAGVGIALIILMFFTFGQVSSWIDAYAISLRLGDNETPNVLDLIPGSRPVLAVIWALVASSGAWVIARSPWADNPKLERAATFACCTLLGLALVKGLATPGEPAGKVPTVAAAEPSGTTRSKPDVYFIVLDGYARQDVLAKYYGFDNAPFIDRLRARGFRVADWSSSNYSWTFLSLASTLNLGYLQEVLGPAVHPGSTDRSLVYEAIRNSLVARHLRELGYRVVHFRSTWGATGRNPHADEEIECEFSVYTHEFVRALVEASWLGALHSKASVDLANCHLANLETLAGMGTEPGPKFVLAHFVLPHHPYLFDRNGNVLRNAIVSNQFEFQRKLWEDRGGYRSQLEFVNRKVLAAIEKVLDESRVPPIILLVSDHGPGLIEGLSREERLAVRFATLSAQYLPGAPENLSTPAASAVNQFRAILSHYFGAELPMLPDRHFSSSYGHPYDFREVPRTNLLQWWSDLGSEAPEERLVSSSSTGAVEP
jgi:hypothetical protein